jgi:prepilin signal peptidase PulO-like enzyme (type II secretory pathway)
VATSWTTVAVSAALAVAASPLLASWSAALADGDTGAWWRPRRVDTARLAIVAAAALTFGALAGGGAPLPAWWLLAAGGTVLAVVDAQGNLLPARLVYPLALLEAAVLTAAAVTTHDAAALARAGLAALIVGIGWFLLAFAAGRAA